MEMTGSPKFLGDPNVPFAHAQATPVSRLNPDRDVRKRRFRFSAWPLQGETQRRSHGKTFEAQSHRFRTRCLRFAVIVTDHHARLASGRWSNPTRRDSRPLGHYQRFLISIHIVIILLRQASWRNPLFCPHNPVLSRHTLTPFLSPRRLFLQETALFLPASPSQSCYAMRIFGDIIEKFG